MDIDEPEIKNLLRSNAALIRFHNSKLKEIGAELDSIGSRIVKIKLAIQEIKQTKSVVDEYLRILQPILKEIQSREVQERLKHESS